VAEKYADSKNEMKLKAYNGHSGDPLKLEEHEILPTDLIFVTL
jgi:hypothetical protein